MRLYLKYISILVRGQLEYRTSFILLTLGQFFLPFSTFIAIYLLFQRFDNLGGWTVHQVALSFAVAHMSFALGETFARGFDRFSSMVIRGDFDRILVRPRSEILQVMGSHFELSRFGRMIQSVVILIYAIMNLQVELTVVKIITIIFMVFSGSVMFMGMFIIGATFCFWTVEGLEVINVLTDGGREIAQYPMDIYKEGFKKFFTFIIPYGTVNYIPMKFIFDKVSGNTLAYVITPLLGSLFIIPCILFWKYGVKRYSSTGS